MELKLQVGGMHCMSCVKSINDAFSKVPGVKNTNVDLEGKTVTIQTETENVKKADLEKIIEDLGFEIL